MSATEPPVPLDPPEATVPIDAPVRRAGLFRRVRGPTNASTGGAALSRAPLRNVHRSRWARLRDWVQGIFGRRSRAPAASAAMHGSGIAAITRDCEVWFDAEASALERDAVELARAAAAANLPRVEISYEEVAEEAALAARCRAVMHGWAESVRTRMRDTLQASTQLAGARLRSYDHEIGALEGLLTEMRETRRELAAAESAAQAGYAHLEVRPFLSMWAYAPLILVLVVVDWIANVPVFSELLPKDPGADAAWRELAARSEALGLWGGLYRIWARAVHNVDASLLAAGVIVFLVYLAHVFGESMRRLLSHSATETPSAVLAIRSHRRQFFLPALLSLTGVVTVAGVLWLARERLEATTRQRVAEVDARIEVVETQLAAARASADLVEVGRLEQEAAGLRILRDQREERADYALIIGRMNLPILLLNLVLAIAAALAGYLVTRGAVRGALVSPRSAVLEQRLSTMRAVAVARRAELTRIETDIGRELAHIAYLLRSKPFGGWAAKSERLSSVVPRFRSENARMRGIDVASVTAFRAPPRLDLPLPPEDDVLTTPAELESHHELYRALRRRAAGVLERMHLAASDEDRPAPEAA